MLVKLLIIGLCSRVEPWKELIKHRAKHVQPTRKSFTPMANDINRLFKVTKPKKKLIFLMEKKFSKHGLASREGSTKLTPLPCWKS
jgi:hypothetical protein